MREAGPASPVPGTCLGAGACKEHGVQGTNLGKQCQCKDQCRRGGATVDLMMVAVAWMARGWLDGWQVEGGGTDRPSCQRASAAAWFIICQPGLYRRPLLAHPRWTSRLPSYLAHQGISPACSVYVRMPAPDICTGSQPPSRRPLGFLELPRVQWRDSRAPGETAVPCLVMPGLFTL